MHRVFWIMILVLQAATTAHAHGLLMSARSEGAQIHGALYFTNGDLAAGETVILTNQDLTAELPVTVVTDERGEFRLDAVTGHRYQLAAYGDEGHNVVMEIVAGGNAKARLIDAELEQSDQGWLPPAWTVLGGILILSMIPAVLRRRKPPAS